MQHFVLWKIQRSLNYKVLNLDRGVYVVYCYLLITPICTDATVRVLFSTYPKCCCAGNPAENKCLVFQYAELQEQSAVVAKKTEQSACCRTKSLYLWECRALNLKPLLISTRSLLLPSGNFCTKEKKRQKKTKTKNS